MELLELRSPDGATSKSRLFSAGKGAPGLVIAPAMGVSARNYDRLATALAERGITTLVGEHRGGETSSVRPRRGVHYGYADLLDDLLLQREQLRPHCSGPVHVLGHSIGAHLGVVGLARWYEPGARLLIVAAGSLHWREWPPGQRVSLYVRTQAAGLVARALGYFPGDTLKFGGVQSARLIAEWSHFARTGRVHSHTHGPLEQRLDAFQPEVLSMHVVGDTFAPRESNEGLLKKLPRANITRRDVAAPAEPTRLDPHFRWMRAPQPIADAAVVFLGAGTSQPPA